MKAIQYLFPDKDLYNKAVVAHAKYNKGILITDIVSFAVSALTVLLLCTNIFFDLNLYGYACSIFLAILAVGIVIGASIAGNDLKKIEKEQKQRLKDSKAHELTLALYKLYAKYVCKQRLIIFSMYLVTLVSSILVGLIFPDTLWSVCCLVFLIIALLIANRSTAKMHQEESALIAKLAQQYSTEHTENNATNDIDN